MQAALICAEHGTLLTKQDNLYMVMRDDSIIVEYICVVCVCNIPHGLRERYPRAEGTGGLDVVLGHADLCSDGIHLNLHSISEELGFLFSISEETAEALLPNCYYEVNAKIIIDGDAIVELLTELSEDPDLALPPRAQPSPN